MSRLQALPIPFAGGHSDEIDEKLLPNGVFSDVSNGRIPQLGSLRLRRGWRPVTMTELIGGTALVAADLYTYQDSLVMMDTSLRLATLTESSAARPWVLYPDGRLPPITHVRTIGNSPELSTHVLRASAAVSPDGVYGCVLQQSATQSVVRVFEMATDETIVYAALPNGDRIRKVVSMGSNLFGLIENTGAALDLYSCNPTNNAPSFALVGTLFAAVVTWFDVAVATDSSPLALHVADVVGGVASYRQFTFAAVQTGATKTVAAADAQAVTLCCAADVTVHYVHQDTAGADEVFLTTFSATSPFTTAAGPTDVNPGQNCIIGRFSVCDSGATVVVASEHALAGVDLFEVSINLITPELTHGTNTRRQQLSSQLFGGGLARRDFGGFGFVRSSGAFAAQLGRVGMYADQNQPWAYTNFGLTAAVQTNSAIPFWPGLAMTGDAIVLTPIDRTPTTAVTPRAVQVNALKLALTARRPGTQLAGALYLTGGCLTQWVGGMADNGMLAPVIATLAASNGAGTMANGVYAYRAILVWVDEKARTHRSIVSLGPTEGSDQVTLAGANDTVTATLHAPKTLRRSGNLITDPRFELYRTEAGPGELFYLVGSATVDSFTDSATIVDTLPDASIIDQPQVYTQGEFGATSGILEMAPARPSSFVAATKRRLLLGSADTSYQWSQAIFPEIPVWFAEPGVSGDAAQAYFDDVEGGRITGVAALDELVFVGTRDRLYLAAGTGPNLAGVGEFDAPHRLPSDFGFYDADSILETSEGLWFQGAVDAMCLLPRGSGTPQPALAVQDRLASGLVGAGYDSTDNVAVWGTSGATAVVRSLDYKLWTGDSLPFTPIALVGHRGALYAIASDGVVWAQHATAYGDGASGATAVALRVATGQIGPFEMAGWGRLATVELLGEFQAAAAILAEISYDDGITWTSLGTHTVTGLSVGAAFQREWFPARQRGQRFRVRVTMTPTVSTTEGCRLTGLVIQYGKRNGATRLDSAKRR